MMRAVYLNGININGKDDLHQFLKEEFAFPDYYGQNLDALVDALTDRSQKEFLVVKDSELLQDNLGHYYGQWVKALRQVEKHTPFRLIVM